MRIRKNAKLSPLLFTSSSSQGGSFPVESHVCQLNQSPWDVIPFDSDSIQFEGGDSFNNGSPDDSIGAVESVESMEDSEEKTKIEDMAVHDNQHGRNNNVAAARNSCCQGFDEKGWPCKNRPKHGQSFCDHHFSLIRSYNNGANAGGFNKKAPAAAATAAAASRRARPRAAKKASSSSNPYEFYYYSGFGPLWGKRRGDRNGEGNKNGNVGGGENSMMVESENGNVIAADGGAEGGRTDSPDSTDAAADDNMQNVVDVSPSSQIDNEGFDYVDDDDEEEEEDGNDDDNGKKRMRKPVKARSLKSLM